MQAGYSDSRLNVAKRFVFDVSVGNTLGPTGDHLLKSLPMRDHEHLREREGAPYSQPTDQVFPTEPL